MKIAVSIIILLLCVITPLSGCISGRVKHAEPPSSPPAERLFIPDGGGGVSGDDKTEYTFTPESSGIWVFEMETFGEGGFALQIVYPDGSSVECSSHTGLYLTEGTEYDIIAGVWTYTVGRKNSYTLTVSPAEVIPAGGGEFPIDKQVVFSLTPEKAGVWTFQTSENGDCVPYVIVYDTLNAETAGYDHGGTDGHNAYISVKLEQDIVYSVEVGFYLKRSGECVFTVSFDGS